MQQLSKQDGMKWAGKIFREYGEDEFNGLALELFSFQHRGNELYREFCGLLGVDPFKIRHYSEIPFLPAEFFKSHEIVTGKHDRFEKVFTSSGTTGMEPAKHHVADLSIYEESYRKAFAHFYGDPSGYCFLALLPGYLERPGSSLVHMMNGLISDGGEGSGFFLRDTGRLATALQDLTAAGKRIFLFGVSFALLDLSERHPVAIPGAIVMETGGMKGRQKELVREELHERICRGLGVECVHAEYGMTELLSQAYSIGKGLFRTPPWMRVMARDVNDPLDILAPGVTGGLNIIDLANVHSCGFIATQDLGKVYEDGGFEVLGRYDHSDIRGCSLLVS